MVCINDNTGGEYTCMTVKRKVNYMLRTQ